MKKAIFVIIFLGFCIRAFAFEYICQAQVRVSPEIGVLIYDFFSIDLNSPVEILTLGIYVGASENYGFDNPDPDTVFENNTSLSQAVKDKMRQVGANACVTMDTDGYIYVNILLQNGRYTTAVYY